MGPRWFAGFQILPNGNIMVCNPGGRVPFFEVNRDKQVVWRTRLTMKQVGVAHGLFVLPGEGCGGCPTRKQVPEPENLAPRAKVSAASDE